MTETDPKNPAPDAEETGEALAGRDGLLVFTGKVLGDPAGFVEAVREERHRHVLAGDEEP